MLSSRPIAIALVSVLTAGLLVSVPSAASADPESARPSSTSSALPDVPVALPSVRVQSLGSGTVAIGQQLGITWSDELFDQSLQAYYTVLTLANAIDGRDYRLQLRGAGPLSAFVLDAHGEPVAYAEHPDASLAAPTLEWEFRAGDQVLLISDEVPLASPTASVVITELWSAQTPWLPSYSLSSGGGQISGTLSPTDPHLPFHGGHVERRWGRPAEAQQGDREIVLAFEGDRDDTDWLSVVVLDSQLLPVEEIPVESGMASFSMAADESFVVTSYAPDEFGAYSFEWILPGTPQVVAVSDPFWWDLKALPTYRVEWRWTGQVRTLSSVGFPAAKVTDRVELSTDGRNWKPAVAGRPTPGIDFASDAVLSDGSYWLRVVTKLGNAQGVSGAFRFYATGDERGWRITSLRLGTPGVLDRPGAVPDLLDLRNAVTAKEVYRDGRTRTRTLPLPPAIWYQFDDGEWRRQATGRPWVALPDSGPIRVETLDRRIRSNVVRATIPKATGAYRASVAPPTRSATVGGAMVFAGTISQQYTDKWRPALNRSSFRVQHRSGGAWVTIYTGRTKSNGKGEFQATVPLRGAGSYRIVVGGGAGKALATWTLYPARPTKTAKIVKPIVTRPSKDHYKVVVDIDQRFTDGLWGPGWSGWKYQVQYRQVGAAAWRSTTAPTAVTHSAPFTRSVRAVGKIEIRVKATYKGAAYYSPTARL